MTMRLRQVALVARELGPVRNHFFAVLGVDTDFKDPGVAEFGLENSVMALADTFLEVVAPVDDNTTAGRFLAHRGGDGGYMILVQVDDVAKQRAKIDSLGVRVVWETKQEHVTAFHVHPKDIGGAIVSFDQMWPPQSWQWAGPLWNERSARNVSNIIAVDVQSGDPAAMAARWSEVFDRPLDGNTLLLDSGRIRFVPDNNGRGAGVTAVELSAKDAEAAFAAARHRGLQLEASEIQICGTTFRLT